MDKVCSKMCVALSGTAVYKLLKYKGCLNLQAVCCARKCGFQMLPFLMSELSWEWLLGLKLKQDTDPKLYLVENIIDKNWIFNTE